MNLFKSLFCKHKYKFIRNIYGDEINAHNGMRSEWRCAKCRHIQYREDYHNIETLNEELDKLYDNFYKDKYNSWKDLRAKTLNDMVQSMRESAHKGNCHIDIVSYCEEKYDDKYYYEKWFDENGLKQEYRLHNQKEKYNDVNCYEFHVRWKHK